MPKAKVNAKPRAARGYKLAEPLPTGVVLKDVFKKCWKIGKPVGQGGFGLIYTASKDLDQPVSETCSHVIKIEPKSNGPLFCEMNFYQRVALPNLLHEHREKQRLKYLSIPEYVSVGLHSDGGKDYRFLVLPRLGCDLQSLFKQSDFGFSERSVCALALRMLDALEFIHLNEYVHADIKAANILLGYEKGAVQPDRVYLVDYGLASRYSVNGRHKEYKEDPGSAHDGTIEFTSRDAHRGVAPSCRGDLEILGYCLLQWLCGSLPWEHKLNNKNFVRDEKIRYMDDIPHLMQTCFKKKKYPEFMEMYLMQVTALEYTEKPDYEALRDMFRQDVSASQEWSLHLPSTKTTTPAKGKKRKSSATHAPNGLGEPTDSDLSPSPIKQRNVRGNKNQNARTRPTAKSVPDVMSPKSAKAKKVVAKKKVPTKSTGRRTKSSVENGINGSTTSDSDAPVADIKQTIGRKRIGRHGDLDSSKSSPEVYMARTAKGRVDLNKKHAPQKKVPVKTTKSVSSHTVGPAHHLSPSSIIPGLRTSPRIALSPRSIIPGAGRYYRPPLNSEQPPSKPSAAPLNRRKVKRSNMPGVEMAVQTTLRK